MDEKETAEHADEVFGSEDTKHDDPADSMRWTNHSDSEEESIKEVRDYVKSIINNFGVEVDKPTEITVSAMPGCTKHSRMCVGVMPAMFKVAEVYDGVQIKVRGEYKPLTEGMREIVDYVSSRNPNIKMVVEDEHYEANYHLIVKS